jgi:hypothetical protein
LFFVGFYIWSETVSSRLSDVTTIENRNFTRSVVRPADVHFSSSSRRGHLRREASASRFALLRLAMVGSAEPLAVHGAYGVVAGRAEFADAHTVVRARAT